MMKNKKIKDLSEFGLLFGIILFLNIICSFYFFRLDLTEDKRYSISPVAKEVVKNLDDAVYVTIYLHSDKVKLSPDFERLKTSIIEKLDQFKSYSDQKIEYRLVDPNESGNGDQYAIQQRYRELIGKGLQPVTWVDEKSGQRQELVLFPSATISYHDREVPVNFYKGNNLVAVSELMNQAVEGVEFEFLAAFRKLTNKSFKSVAYITGHNELARAETFDFVKSVSENYTLERVVLDSLKDLSRFACVVIAGPTMPYSERDKYLLDQYVVKGGKLLVMMDATDIRQDSLKGGETFALNRNSNLDDLFFRWGVKLNQDVVMDLQSCSKVRVITGTQGETQLLPFPYYPIVHTFSTHPVVRNMGGIYTRFIGSIDTVKADGVVKIPLAFTSKYTKTVSAPMQIDLDALRAEPDPSQYNKQHVPVMYLLEGNFTSLYANRSAPDKSIPLVKQGKGGGVIIFSDADVMRNDVDLQRKMPVPLGYDRETHHMHSNKDLLMNTLDYLTGEGIITVRAKEIVLRPLDKVAIVENRVFLQVLNVALPVVLIIVFGVLRFMWRKKRYASY